MKKTVLGVLLLLAGILLAGSVLAHPNGGGMMGEGYGFSERYPTADSDALKEITAQYAVRFDDLASRMEAQRDAIHRARDNEATTVGQLNALRDEMHAIKDEYRALNERVDTELSEKFGQPGFERHAGRRGGGRQGGFYRMHGRFGVGDGFCR